MSNENYQSICATAHADMRIKANVGCTHLAALNNSAVLAEEVAEMSGSCPVVFLQNEEAGSFQLSALFALLPDENLFIDKQGNWTGTYIPVGLNLDPFAVFVGAEKESDRMKIRKDSSRLSTSEGEKLFENGQESAYLTDIKAQLETVIDASVQTERFIQNLVNRNLLSQFAIKIEGLPEGPKVINGLYTINTDEFAYLTNEDVLMFHEMHYWGPIYAIQHSMKQFKKLVQLHNIRHPGVKIKLTLHIDKEDAE
ncbi:SapC family protein [Thalassotalea sp. PLHSN55]|uniref:SapC family protein n=1 Tax=Thalassotalea sp. PLHSN55 TaxID=3435888 RepID=UPI003F8430E8